MLESPGITQSNSYEAGLGNTQWALSALTAAGSPGCLWPTSSTSSSSSSSPLPPLSSSSSVGGVEVESWQAYQGLLAHGTRPTMLARFTGPTAVEQGKALCITKPGCYVLLAVQNKTVTPTPSMTVTLYGGGMPGNLSATPIALVNASARMSEVYGPSGCCTTKVYVRSSSAAAASQVACLEQASAADLVVVNAGPPHGDTLYVK